MTGYEIIEMDRTQESLKDSNVVITISSSIIIVEQ